MDVVQICLKCLITLFFLTNQCDRTPIICGHTPPAFPNSNPAAQYHYVILREYPQSLHWRHSRHL